MARFIVRDFGTCLKLTGVSGDNVTVAHHASLNLTSAITLSAWIFPSDISGGNRRIIQKGDGDDQYRFIFDSGKLKFHVAGVTNGELESTTLPKLSKWSHILGTYDSATGFIGIYIDGLLVASASNASGELQTQDDVLKLFGKHGSGVDGDYFKGLADEVAILNQGVTQAEVEDIYYRGVYPQGSLIGHWKFDEGDGSSATDSSGNGNTGTITGATYSTDVYMKPRTAAGSRFTARDMGTCLSFNGASGYVEVNDSASLDISSTFTLMAWVLPRTIGEGGAGRIIDKSSTYGFQFIGTNQLQVFSNGTTKTSANNVISYGRWQHLAVVLDSGGTSFYKNGALLSSTTTMAVPTPNNNKIYIGNRSDDGRTFDGFIDEVKVYATPLSLSQIQAIYYLGSEPDATNLKGYWKFDEGSGTSATDSSGNNNTGTIATATYSTNVFIKPRTAV